MAMKKMHGRLQAQDAQDKIGKYNMFNLSFQKTYINAIVLQTCKPLTLNATILRFFKLLFYSKLSKTSDSFPTV